jgi:shikimate dehydrogenase
MYPETGILSVAKKEGAEISNGLGMLLHQGAKSFHIWTGKDPDINIMRSSLEKEVYSSVK